MNKQKPVRTFERLPGVKVSNGFSFQITTDQLQNTVATSDSMLDNSNALHRNDRTHQVDSSKVELQQFRLSEIENELQTHLALLSIGAAPDQ